MTIAAIIETARHREPCSVCHAPPGQPCACDGTHLCRVALAAHDGHITYGDAASLYHDMDVFAGSSVIPEATP